MKDIEPRPDPNRLLKKLQNEDRAEHKGGQLRIFFGYCAGVGKTYTMLRAAHRAAQLGTDIVAGYIEPHTRPETMALLGGLESLPPKTVRRGDTLIREFDLDAALRRKPKIILVDELAHSNAPGCRHAKRWQDIEELLDAGIDVYTTVNVQHIESLNDTVAAITGITVRERVPDSFFDRADFVDIVDIEPEQLIDRLKLGKIYRAPQARLAIQNFFTEEHLTALREVALRRCADRVGVQGSNAGFDDEGAYHTREHILVCLSSSPTNAGIIRTAARMARAFNGAFSALFVQTPEFTEMGMEDRRRLRDNIHLAEQLGAKTETVRGSDVPFQIAEFVRLSAVSRIVIGRSAVSHGFIRHHTTLTDRLIEQAPSVDIHIIPDRTAVAPPMLRKQDNRRFPGISLKDLVKHVTILAGASLIGVLFDRIGFGVANIIIVYVLAVLIVAVVTQSRLHSFCASIAGVLIFNYLFTTPRYSLEAYDPAYPVTFFVMFAAAWLTGSLAVRLKKQARESAVSAFRIRLFFDACRAFRLAETREDIYSATALYLIRLMHRDVVIYPVESGFLRAPKVYRADPDTPPREVLTPSEREAAQWVATNQKPAGTTTHTFANAACYYLPIRALGTDCGVLGLVLRNRPPEPDEANLLQAILDECAVALRGLNENKE